MTTEKLTNWLTGNWVILTILLLAALLRLWNLGSIPSHLTPDEASLGYNAYSILKTGRDEYGEILPIIFKSFGDYKPGLYVYLTVPSVFLFGLNEFAVRFPAALFGIVSVLLVYLIAGHLFNNRKLSLISAFIMAITPWSIYFSRGAWEVNVSLALTLAGIYFFFKSLAKPKLLILSSIFFSLTLLTYQGAKLSTAIVVLILVLLYWRELLSSSRRKLLVVSFAVGFLISLPILISLFQGKTGRLTIFSIFANPRPRNYLQIFLNQGGEKVGDLSYYLFHSETLNFKRGIVGRWFNHFSGRFLFFEGDWQNPRHTAPNQGVLILSDIVLLVMGMAALARARPKKAVIFIFLLLALAPLPAILSRDQVHAVRSFNLVIPLVLVLGLGLNSVLENRRRILQLVFFGFFLVSFVYFLDAYFIHLPTHNSRYWEYGYKQIVETVTPIQANYKQVRVQQSYAQPYIFFLFFQKYDPAKYQKQAKLVENSTGDVGQIEHLDNIYFAPIDWSVNRGDKDTLFVADTLRMPLEDSSDPTLFNLIREIKYLDRRYIAFRIIEVK
jgi:4-amino-4-deoxy-L-arabinose transferase-like glycosyltransferase